MSSLEIIFVSLLIISIIYNLLFLVKLRRYHARLSHLNDDIQNFVHETDSRINSHDQLIKDVREELKTLDKETISNPDVLKLKEKNDLT